MPIDPPKPVATGSPLPTERDDAAAQTPPDQDEDINRDDFSPPAEDAHDAAATASAARPG